MTCIGGLLDKMTGSVILTAKEVKEVEDHIDQLEAENAKLRELMADMFSDMVDMDCELKHNRRTFMVCTRYEPLLRELGIEVE